MYVPKYAQFDEPNLIYEFMESHSFATIVTHQKDLFANHFPFLIGRENGRITLSGHMARNNPQWKHLESGSQVLVIFQGPHAYISPGIYVNKLNVPTWNYTAVHLYGRARAMHDAASIENILTRTVEKFENQRTQPWKYDLPQDFRGELIKAIVGFEIEVERVEGKFKLSQNRDAKDYIAVIEEFTKHTDSNSKELLKYMTATRG